MASTRMKTQQMCRDFLKLWCSDEVEAIQASIRMQEVWGVRVDWHEMGDALEWMTRNGSAERTGTSRTGLALYIIRN